MELQSKIEYTCQIFDEELKRWYEVDSFESIEKLESFRAQYYSRGETFRFIKREIKETKL